MFSDTYESGKTKLKLAEKISDFGGETASSGEDVSKLKKSRHSRSVRKMSTSDGELSNNDYPRAPHMLSQHSSGRESSKEYVRTTSKPASEVDSHAKAKRADGIQTETRSGIHNIEKIKYKRDK